MRIILIIALSVIAFGGGFVGVYMNMPEPPPVEDPVDPVQSLSPEDVLELLPDSAQVPNWITEMASQSSLASSLVDSLTNTRSALHAANTRIQELESALADLRQKNGAAASRREVATAMASTLPKLEPDELRAILDGLDERALFELYDAATSRNRTAILQALKPDRAAALVQEFMNPQSSFSSNSVAAGDQ